jgi:hypothetical protein
MKSRVSITVDRYVLDEIRAKKGEGWNLSAFIENILRMEVGKVKKKQKICRNCSFQVPENEDFCPNCHKLDYFEREVWVDGV